MLAYLLRQYYTCKALRKSFCNAGGHKYYDRYYDFFEVYSFKYGSSFGGQKNKTY